MSADEGLAGLVTRLRDLVRRLDDDGREGMGDEVEAAVAQADAALADMALARATVRETVSAVLASNLPRDPAMRERLEVALFREVAPIVESIPRRGRLAERHLREAFGESLARVVSDEAHRVLGLPEPEFDRLAPDLRENLMKRARTVSSAFMPMVEGVVEEARARAAKDS